MPVPNKPRTFSVFDVRTNIEGQYLPVLILDDLHGSPQVSREWVSFALNEILTGTTLQRLRAAAFAVGMLHDFLVLHEKNRVLTAEELQVLILKFFAARGNGTMLDEDGSDPTGLYWTSVNYRTYLRDQDNIYRFSRWCVDRFGYVPLFRLADTRQESVTLMKQNFQNSAMGQRDFFFHLARHRSQQKAVLPGLGRRKSRRRKEAVGNERPIPQDELCRLIAETPSIVQRMVFILGAFGGPRISEQLHLWRDDVLPGRFRPHLFPDDVASDVPLVVLAHPTESTYTGRLTTGSVTRLEALRSRYRLRPRCLDEKDPLFAGWKGMAEDNPLRHISQVFWISEEWAKVYYQHYEALLKQVYPRVPNGVLNSHPFLLINDDPKTQHFGQPLKMSNIKKGWERACRRIGVEPYTGPYTLHSLRHKYVHFLKGSGFRPDEIQRLVHHGSVEAHDGYGKDASRLNMRLRELPLRPAVLELSLEGL
ncbi:hypothetical protein [Roseomonas genomospecies 6]|nr:hypothetical protein [Roseomonas genomospecies 6]